MHTHTNAAVYKTHSGRNSPRLSVHRLRPVDVEFMKALHEKVNIIPLIAKADCLTPTEIKKLKERVSRRPAGLFEGSVETFLTRLRVFVSSVRYERR